MHDQVIAQDIVGGEYGNIVFAVVKHHAMEMYRGV